MQEIEISCRERISEKDVEFYVNRITGDIEMTFTVKSFSDSAESSYVISFECRAVRYYKFSSARSCMEPVSSVEAGARMIDVRTVRERIRTHILQHPLARDPLPNRSWLLEVTQGRESALEVICGEFDWLIREMEDEEYARENAAD